MAVVVNFGLIPYTHDHFEIVLHGSFDVLMEVEFAVGSKMCLHLLNSGFLFKTQHKLN